MDLIVFIEQHWTLLVGVLGIMTTYVRMEYAIKNLTRRDEEIDKKVCAMEQDNKINVRALEEIRLAIARIETTLKWLHEAITENKK